MRNRRLSWGAAVSAFLFVFLLRSPSAEGQVCTEATGSFFESLMNGTYIDEPQCSAKLWYKDTHEMRDTMTLNKLGANFVVSSPSNVPAWISVLAAADFNMDGWTDYIGSSSSYSNALLFVKNDGVNGNIGTFLTSLWIDGSAGNASGTPILGVGGASIEAGYHGGMTAGDYDGDGDVDFFYVSSVFDSPYSLVHVWLYREYADHRRR